MKRKIGMLFSVGLMAGAASADLTIVDVDNATTNLIPTVTVLGVEGQFSPPERWASVTTNGTDLVGVLPDPQQSTDVYWQKGGLSVPVESARYIQVHYEINGEAFTGSNHRLFLTSGLPFGGINMANDEQIPTSPGAHSFIIDMFSDPAKDYEGAGGNWSTFRWDMWNETSLTDNAGKSITIKKIVYGNTLGTFSEAYYVASSPTDWTDPTAWSDGNPASAGNLYYATNSVVLETPATTSTFPGSLLSLSAPQRMELMVSGADVITINDLLLDGGDLGAGAGSGEAGIAGTITVSDDSVFSGATDNSRDLRVLSQILGGTRLELTAPTKTIYIDNPTNQFSGTWVVADGTTEFASAGGIGSGAAILVQSNGTLRVAGDWDGTTAANTLSVTDSPNAQVDLGTYTWSVISLTVGSSNLPSYATYSVADLNAIGANALFTGSGTIYVGPPPPTTYYLQEKMPAGKTITDKDVWFDAPTGGNQMPDAAIFEGSTFDVNGFEFRSKSTGLLEEFKGILLVDAEIAGYWVHYGGNFAATDEIRVEAPFTIRPHRSTANGGVSTTVKHLNIGPAGEMHLRVLEPNSYTQTLSVETLSGSGLIDFGGTRTQDSIGEWSFSVSDAASAFSGTVKAGRGQLTLYEVTLVDASLTIPSGNDNSVVLSNDVVFASVTFGESSLSNGVYTAAQLNTAFETDRFSGAGTIAFELPQNTFAKWAEGLGLTGNDALPTADLEPDGMDNMLEYALGGDPSVADADVFMPTYSIVDVADVKWVEYVFNRRLDADARGLSYDVIISGNLASGSWDNIGQTAETGTTPIDEEFESVVNRIATDLPAKFISLKVTETVD